MLYSKINECFEDILRKNLSGKKVINALIFTYNIDEYGLDLIDEIIGDKLKIVIYGDESSLPALKTKRRDIIPYLVKPENNGGNKGVCHSKLYLFRFKDDSFLLFIGSANLTKAGLRHNREFVAFIKNNEHYFIWKDFLNFLNIFNNKIIKKKNDIGDKVNDIIRSIERKIKCNKENNNNEKFLHTLDKKMLNYLKGYQFKTVISPSYDKIENIFENISNDKIENIFLANKTIERGSNDNDSFKNNLNEIANKYLIYDLHGKLYELIKGNDKWILFGSPNFTCNAFTKSWKEGGNIETAILFKSNDDISKIIEEAEEITDKIEGIPPSDNLQNNEKHLIYFAYHKEGDLKDGKYLKIYLQLNNYKIKKIIKDKVKDNRNLCPSFHLKLKNTILKLVEKNSYYRTEKDVKYEKIFNDLQDSEVVFKLGKNKDSCPLYIISLDNNADNSEITKNNQTDPLDFLIGNREVVYQAIRQRNISESEKRKNNDSSTEENITNLSQYRSRQLVKKLRVLVDIIKNKNYYSKLSDLLNNIEHWNYYNKYEKIIILLVLKNELENDNDFRIYYKNDINNLLKKFIKNIKKKNEKLQ